MSDVNEVIQKFLTQDETHNNLVVMTKEAQARIDGPSVSIFASARLAFMSFYSSLVIERACLPFTCPCRTQALSMKNRNVPP